MRVNLSESTISELEEASGKKITRNGDKVIEEVAQMALEKSSENGPEIMVCDNTEKFANKGEENA